jgi:hypothetical protein
MSVWVADHPTRIATDPGPARGETADTVSCADARR